MDARSKDWGADVEISETFDEAERLALDVIVVTRGGGTLRRSLYV